MATIQPIDFTFPSSSPHEGIPLGNGTLGVLAWGGQKGGSIKLTLSRQDYWQHRGVVEWNPAVTYKDVVACIRDGRGKAEDLVRLVEPGTPFPTRLPMGRFELSHPRGVRSGQLDVARGVAKLEGGIQIIVLRDRPVCLVSKMNLAVTPVANCSRDVVEYREKYGIESPRKFRKGNFCGWTQTNFDQPVLCCAALVRGDGIAITSVFGATPQEAQAVALRTLQEAPAFPSAARAVAAFYRSWWSQAASVKLSHRDSQVLFDLGMFKLASCTAVGSPAVTLQGPWVEDDHMPPWGSDYHFNINVQMCHWPMLPGNHPEMYEPLVRMLTAWMPRMRQYARTMMGIDDGVMIPHASDDRCIPADTNWRCQMDHGSAGWTAVMLWDLYRYTGDKAMLRSIGYPMLRGAMRVYEEMIEDRDGQYVLPLAPSPEFCPRGACVWGENPSFQLAIIHALLAALPKAAADLRIDEPRLRSWQDIRSRLPKATIENGHIALWKGLDLPESHRHHSHLAGIYPFETLDIDGADDALVRNSMKWWVSRGSGMWTGWCMTWAAILWARRSCATAAFAMLEQYRRFFTGPVNYASRHDAVADGFTTFRGSPHMMQLDAALGAAAAILEMLAHQRGGKVHCAPAVPEEWGDVSFDRLRLPGGKLAFGRRRNGRWVKLGTRKA
ncbi:MAG: hypothetical protein WC869_12045 [Phycisphaerae bacterium]|jgi:hypothetical protein